jgi:sporulation protein YlmC with PRC-barrel domain
LQRISGIHSKESIEGLINKKVYSESGYYIGKIKEVILGENRIDSLKINIDKKYKFKAGGIIISYKHVKNVSEIIIIDQAVIEYLEN